MKSELHLVDYVVWIQLLAISLGIGSYVNFKDTTYSNVIPDKYYEYTLASRQLLFLPVVASMLTSFLSAATLMGGPNKFFQYGISYFSKIISFLWISPCFFLFIPVFANSSVITTYEYIGLRFNNKVRILGAVSFILTMVLYLGMVLHAPCLALEYLLGSNYWTMLSFAVFVSVTYTALGGLQVVVWTDVVQLMLLFATPVIILSRMAYLDEFKEVWNALASTKRLNIVYGFNLQENYSLLSLTFGDGIVFLSVYATNQVIIQRYLSLKSRKSYKSLFIPVQILHVGFLCILFVTSSIIAYSFIACDPVKDGRIKSYNLLVGLYVYKVFKESPGVAGVFIASFFGASLGTVSSGLHSLATVTLNDVIIQFKKNLSVEYKVLLMRLFVVLYGLILIGISSLIPATHFVKILSMISIGVYSGPNLALFSMGMLLPFVNYFGAISGFLTSNVVIIGLYVGDYQWKPRYMTKISSVGDCNITEAWIANHTEVPVVNSAAQTLFSITTNWEPLIGMIIGIIVGCVVSHFTAPYIDSDDRKVDSELISPLFRNLFSSHIKLPESSDISHHDELEMRISNIIYERKKSIFYGGKEAI